MDYFDEFVGRLFYPDGFDVFKNFVFALGLELYSGRLEEFDGVAFSLDAGRAGKNRN